MKEKSIVKAILVCVGFFCVGIGTAGIFLPVLPTVPFYVLAAFCFHRGSERFHGWFTASRLYKKHLDGFTKNRGMTLRAKLTILIPVSLMLTLTFILINSPVVKIFIVLLLSLKIWYFIFRIKTIKNYKCPKPSVSD